MMKLLADENVHSAIIRWLRDRGHDVSSASESQQQWPDDELLAAARTQDRILLSTDLDFGELVVRRRLLVTGIILVRLERLSIRRRLEILQAVWDTIEARASGHLLIIGPHSIRVRRLMP